MQKNSGNSMKIVLILPGNLWFCPYVNIYVKILEKNNIKYDIISWNRDGSESSGKFTFDMPEKAGGKITKFSKFINYLKFIKNRLDNDNYDKVIVFGPQLGILLYSYLKKKYNKKFIFDYRDLSIEQLPVFKWIFKKLLSISNVNVISSIGFKKYLPQQDYIVSHNFNLDSSADYKNTSADILQDNSINIVTIGSIRDYSANIEVVKSLANKPSFNLYFIGKGDVSNLIKNYVELNNINNVFFSGFYNKSEEAELISNATFLNIYYPKIKSHSSAMSNRFYNSLVYKRPMIVTSDSIQGHYVEEYNLGLSVYNCENLAEKIIQFKNKFEANAFDASADKLLLLFIHDYEVFNVAVKQFLKN